MLNRESGVRSSPRIASHISSTTNTLTSSQSQSPLSGVISPMKNLCPKALGQDERSHETSLIDTGIGCAESGFPILSPAYLGAYNMTKVKEIIVVAEKSSASCTRQLFSNRPRSHSLSNIGNAPSNLSPKITLSKCPCQKSIESSWKRKCSACNQIWHTDCANLKASKQIPEKVILTLDKTRMCPWCYTPAFMKQAGHPSSSNESKLMGTVVTVAVGEKILEEMRHDIIPEFQLTVDNLIKIRLKEVTKAVEDQINIVTEKTRELETLKESYLSTAESRKPAAQKTHKKKLTPVLSENPTESVGEYKENFLSTDEVVNLRHALDALEFSTVNGREVASFGEEYVYGGAPKNNKKDIPDSFKAIVEKVHSDPNYEGELLNQIVINKYTGLSHLPEHSDDEPVIHHHSNIFTISIGE